MEDQLPMFEEADPEEVASKSDDGHERDLRTVELTTREVSLLLKYGYPFFAEERKLRSSTAVDGIHRVRLGAYWVEMMQADLVRSAKEIRSHRLLEELDELYSVLEFSLNDATGKALR
jgi:hypothetical protein